MTVDRLTRLGLVVPAVFAVFGTLIINIGLSSYGLFDSQIFRLHAILVGATFFTFCLAMAVLFCAFTNTVDPSQDSQVRIALLTLWKVLIASLALYSMVAPSFSPLAGYFLLLAYLFAMVDRLREGEVGGVEKGVFYLFLAVSTIMGGMEFYTLYRLAPEFREVAHLITAVGFFYYMGVEGRVPIIKKRKADPNYRPKSLFGHFMSRETMKWDIALAALFLLLSTGVALSKYSTELYPKIPKSWGGMKTQKREITCTDGRVLRGRILHATTSALYVIQADSSIAVVREAEIDRITEVVHQR